MCFLHIPPNFPFSLVAGLLFSTRGAFLAAECERSTWELSQMIIWINYSIPPTIEIQNEAKFDSLGLK